MKNFGRKVTLTGLILTSVFLSFADTAVLLTLSEAEETAVQNSFTSRKQRYEMKAMDWERKNVASSYLPSVNYNFNYLRMDQTSVEQANSAFRGIKLLLESLAPVIGLPPDVVEQFSENPNELFENSFSHELTVSQPLFNGGVEIATLNLANANRLALIHQHRAETQRTILLTRRAYLDALSAQLALTLGEKSLDWAKQNLKNTSLRFQIGSVPKTDLLGWEIEVAKKENELLAAQTAHKASLVALYHTMGKSSTDTDLYIRLQNIDYFENLNSIKTVGISEYSVENNPALLSIRAYSELASRSKSVALSQFLPRINAFFSYRWNAWDKIRPHDTYRGWTAGAVLSVPLFSGFRNSTNYQKVKYEYLKSVVTYEEFHSQLQGNLQALLWRQESMQAGIAVSSKQITLMERQLELMQQRYDGGLINQSQLLEIELGLRQAQIAYAQSLFNSFINHAEIELITGNLESMQ